MKNQKEIWKDVPNYEGLYQVSNLGKVKSLDREVLQNGSIIRRLKGVILKQTLTTTGYLSVFLSKNGVPKIHTVHKLVAITFLGHKPNGYKLVIHHIDGDKTNNSEYNLREITHRENVSMGYKNKSSKYTGVCYHKQHKKWVASIQISGKNKHLGYFDSQELAYESYKNNL